MLTFFRYFLYDRSSMVLGFKEVYVVPPPKLKSSGRKPVEIQLGKREIICRTVPQKTAQEFRTFS
jgi:hypothetical protein